MAFVIVEKGNSGDIGKRFAIGEDAVLIGRGATGYNPDITLHDDYVSRRHAEISFDKNYFMLRDLNSTNGTALDGLRIEPGKFYRLQHDSVIGLGVALGAEARVALRFRESPTASTTKMAAPGETSPLIWLRVDLEKGEIWVDERQITVSRKEYDLILCLQAKTGKVCSKDEVIAKVWPEAKDSAGVSDAAIDQLVHRLRLKIEHDPAKPRHLISRKGFGYMLV